MPRLALGVIRAIVALAIQLTGPEESMNRRRPRHDPPPDEHDMTGFPWLRGLGALAVSAALASCAAAPGSAETDRIACPAGAAAIVPAPLPPQAHAEIPAGFDTRLTELLAALPPAPSAPDVAAVVTSGLTPPGVDPNTGLENLPPTVEAAVDGTDVGISLRAASGRGCLLGARVGGHVSVGRPSRVQMQPGELTCDPQTALHLFDITPPH
jgi:hypothetical protein